MDHLYELVRRRAHRYPRAVALGAQQGLRWRTLRSDDLLQLVDGLAQELESRHAVQAGDRVVLWVPNHWRAPVYLFALWKLGAIVVPFDREMNPDAASRILHSVNPRRVIVGYGERPVWALKQDVVEWWEPHASGSSSDWLRPAEDLAAIVFTSGTTGNPKGCMITHTNLLSQVTAGFERIPLDPTCRLASILPLSHLFELTCGLLYPLAAGSAIHYIPSRRAADILRVLSEQHITHMMVVPQLLGLMGQNLDKQLQERLPGRLYQGMNALAQRLPLSARRNIFWMVHRKLGGQLRLIASGGAPLASETQQLWERLGVRIVQGYGTSECSPIVACGAVDGTTPIGSVGKPVRGVEVQLNTDGELLVSGPNVMRGYWRDPERTAQVFEHGWYATGDLARIDGAGNIFLSGRARDLIVLPSGLNVWPQDVEDVLRQEPGVGDAAVLAVVRPGGGASLHAYLIPSGGAAHATDLSALVARSNGRLAQHQRLASASWWTQADFPRTSTLKVRRHLLPPPEQLETVNVESVLAADDPVAQAVAGAARLSLVRDDQTLVELGLDSLGLVELASALESKTGKVVADSDLRLDMSVAQVRAFVASAAENEEERPTSSAPARVTVEQPMWPYTWGRGFRVLSFPLDLLYAYGVTRTIIVGGEHLRNVPGRLIIAGTHHGFADMPLVRHAIKRAGSGRMARRLIVAAGAAGFTSGGIFAKLGILTLGLYPLQQYGEREASLRRLARLADQGNVIVIFPQGTHARPEQELMDDPLVRFRPGIGHLAEALEAAVLPFGVAGTERLMPAFLEDFHGRVMAGIPVALNRGPLAIAFGAPLTIDRSEAPAAFAARLQRVCYALTAEAASRLA